MRSVRPDSNVPATRGLVELNHHARDELKEVVNEAAFDGQGFSEEEESKINEDVNGRRTELALAQDGPLRQHQQPQGQLVQWERFLPVRSLKVLLVENDDSTRHVVSALLRNCSYEVTAVANGIEAWKVLADLTKHIDLVLTEVVMPYLSGVGLLTKIMSNISCKSIPVIMMSSDDSMGIVFNCLSKGAVDFLVKPIRKNELKNLWQHVWRKCHSSSGSGSESGIRTQKYAKSRSIEGSDNDTGSNDEDGYGSISLTAKDGSDNGSDTQSSWSKRSVEVDRTKAKSPWDQLVHTPDSTCAQVAHTRHETISNYWAPTTATRACDGEDNKLDTLVMGKDLAIGVSRDPDQQFVGPSKNMRSNLARMSKDKPSVPNSKKVRDELQKGTLELICETESGEMRTETADLVDTITRTTNAHMKSAATEVPNELSKIANIKEKDICYSKELPLLELSLKRLRGAEDAETSAQQRNVLRHSDLSAFSRYNTPTNSKQTPTGNAHVGSCSPLEKSSEAAKAESTQYLNYNSNKNPNQRSNGSSNNDDMGSTTNNAFAEPENLADDKPIPKSVVNMHSSSALQSAHQNHTSSLQPEIPSIVDGETADTVSMLPKAAHQQVQVRHHHHHYHHHHHHVHNMQQQKQVSKHDDVSLRNMTSNVLAGPVEGVEGNAANYGSASGSNNRSNGENGSTGQKGSSSAAVAEGAKMGSDTGVTGNCGTGDGTGSGSGSGVDQSRLAQREAALTKFRQKRKERCFEKKVRYHSRKKLAEQRPRVRGQFVRQGVQEIKNEEDANS